jgi:hypothetical protein
VIWHCTDCYRGIAFRTVIPTEEGSFGLLGRTALKIEVARNTELRHRPKVAISANRRQPFLEGAVLSALAVISLQA